MGNQKNVKMYLLHQGRWHIHRTSSKILKRNEDQVQRWQSNSCTYKSVLRPSISKQYHTQSLSTKHRGPFIQEMFWDSSKRRSKITEGFLHLSSQFFLLHPTPTTQNIVPRTSRVSVYHSLLPQPHNYILPWPEAEPGNQDALLPPFSEFVPILVCVLSKQALFSTFGTSGEEDRTRKVASSSEFTRATSNPSSDIFSPVSSPMACFSWVTWGQQTIFKGILASHSSWSPVAAQ